MLSLLRTASLRRLFLAQFQSELGTGAAYVALVLVAYQRLHSGWAIALVLLADFLPGIVLGAPFGALADRLPRRPLLIGADLLRAGAFAALALIPSFPATVVLALLAGTGGALFRPTMNAALPGLVGEEQRSPATALYGMNCSIGVTVGPALTALVLLVGPPTLMLAANSATFLLSAALLSSIRIDSDAPSPREPAPGKARTSLWSSTLDGAKSAAQMPGLVTLLAIGAVSILAGALMNVAEPLLATGPLHAGDSGYSLFVATYGAAMAAGSFATSRAGTSLRGLRLWLIAGLALQGAGMLGAATANSLGWAAVNFGLAGAGNALIVAPEIRLLQELAGERLLGRVFGLRDMLGNVAFVLAFLSAGAALGLLGVRAVFALGGAMLVTLTVAAWLRFRPTRPRELVSPVAEPA
jgi:MFS family permease